MLYRTVVEDVPVGDYTIPLGQARIARSGQDITLVGWGQQVAVLERSVRVSRVIPSSVICLALHGLGLPLTMRDIWRHAAVACAGQKTHLCSRFMRPFGAQRVAVAPTSG